MEILDILRKIILSLQKQASQQGFVQDAEEENILQVSVIHRQMLMENNYRFWETTKRARIVQRATTEVMAMTQGTAASQTGQSSGNVNQTPSAGQLQASPVTQTYCHPERNATWQLPK